MARIKPNPEVIENRSQAEGALAEMAALDRKIGAIETEMQEAIDLAKKKAAQAAAPMLARRKDLADALAVFAKLNRQSLFGKLKSADLGFGVIGFRISTRLVQLKGVTVAMTLEKLKQFGFTEAVRTKEEPDKDVMSGWPDERLETVGMKRQQSDTFFIEIKKDEVPQGNAAAVKPALAKVG
jgi:phage host-nuclease inhibitor protein Gam